MTRSESMTSLDQLEKINQYGGDGEGSLWAVEKNDYKKPKLPQVSSALATKASLVRSLRTRSIQLFGLPSCNHAVWLSCNSGLGQLDRCSIPGQKTIDCNCRQQYEQGTPVLSDYSRDICWYGIDSHLVVNSY